MNDKTIFLIWTMICIGSLITLSQISCETKEKSQQNKKVVVGDTLMLSSKESDGIDIKALAGFDSIIVIHFHPTAQCSCCINVGNFAKKGLEKFYSKPYKERHIIFREYDIDKDSSIAKRYKIFWSALGFEKFCGDEINFKEIESVWQFCEEKEEFLINFQEELATFIANKENGKVKNTPK